MIAGPWRWLEIAVLIVGSRAFLIQPMVIPTGSAQPTLWGVTYEDLRDTNTPVPSWPMLIGMSVSIEPVRVAMELTLANSPST